MGRIVLVLVVCGGLWWFLGRGGCGTSGALKCADAALDEGVGTTLEYDKVCAEDVFLCYQRAPGFQVVRWPLEKGKLRIRVPLPDFADDEHGRELRDAAVEGIMAWDQRPFPLVVETGALSLRPADFSVAWAMGAGGGITHVRYDIDGKRLRFAVGGMQVRATFDQIDRDERIARVRTTAMHEMGHALGLQHSDSKGDVMYFEYLQGVTPDGPSARDLRSVAALYRLPNGATVR